MIGGMLASWVTLSGANALLAHTGLGVISPEGHLFGLALGCVSGSVIWKRRLSLRQAALWNARFCAGTTALSIGALVLCLSLIGGNHGRFFTPEWLRLAVPVLLQWIGVAAVAGACSGALTGLWRRTVCLPLENSAAPATAAGKPTLSA
jgi:hypothetical protein